MVTESSIAKRRQTLKRNRKQQEKTVKLLKRLMKAKKKKKELPEEPQDLSVCALYGVIDDPGDSKVGEFHLLYSRSTVKATGEVNAWTHPNPNIDRFDDLVMIEGRHGEDVVHRQRQVPLREALELITPSMERVCPSHD